VSEVPGQRGKHARPQGTWDHGFSTIKEFMVEWVSRDIELCIGCKRCMEACPVTKKHFGIGELNHATEVGTGVPESIKEFAWNCVQCGRCVPVCPAGARRDYMVLFIKHKLRGEAPRSYKRYLAIKGPFPGIPGKIGQTIYAMTQKRKHRGLARFMETLPREKTPLLFYPGCYVYVADVMKRTLRLLDHVGKPYAVLGGLTTCCGIPQLLHGEFELADRCLDALHEKIMPGDPSIIITACAECFEALLRIKAKFGEDFEVLTVAEYLLRHADRFPAVRVREKVTLHDSCRLARRYRKGNVAREVVARFAGLEEMERTRENTMCCYYWNHDLDPANHQHRVERTAEAGRKAQAMVCDCISCYDEYIKDDYGIEIIELLHLFEESLETGAGRKGGTTP